MAAICAYIDLFFDILFLNIIVTDKAYAKSIDTYSLK